MKTLILSLILVTSVAFSKDAAHVRHPAPKKPKYLAEDLYAVLKPEVPAPPATGSEKQASDEKELLEYQKSRSKEDCAAANQEVMVSLQTMFGEPAGPLPTKTVERLTPFFEQIRNDGDYFVQKLKIDFPRKRPFLYVKKLVPCVPKEVTGAYPSGHAMLSQLFAMTLTDLYPEKKETFDARAKEIRDHRVMAGMHHRTDVDTGRDVGMFVFNQLRMSPQFRSDLDKLREPGFQ